MLQPPLARRITAINHVVPSTSRPRPRVQNSAHQSLRSTICQHPLPQLRQQSTSSSHHDLPTFLSHATRTGLDRTSTTYNGTYYEYLTQTLLRRYGFSLTRVGGRGDRGVDLKGTWSVSTEGATSSQEKEERFSLRVIIQCKHLKAKVGPNLIRELEGAIAGRTNTLGVLVGTKGATKGVRDAMGRSRVGVCWVCLESERAGGESQGAGVEEGDKDEDEEGSVKGEEEGAKGIEGFDDILQAMKSEIVDKVSNLISAEKGDSDLTPPSETETTPTDRLGRVQQMLWNKTAREMGLQGLDVVMKYRGTRDAGGELGKEVALMWQGKSVIGLDPKVEE